MPDRPTIRFCIHNPSIDERHMLHALGAESHDCFGRCSRCFECRYLMIDTGAGEQPFEGDSYEQIIAEHAPDANPPPKSAE